MATRPVVHAPFAFVPLNEKVYFPPTEHKPKPSHDVPLAEGFSGRLKIKITAKTPILVGGERSVKNEHGVNCNHIHPLKLHVLEEGEAVEKYGFEGSTLRGAIREVLEIASFGKVTRYNETQRWIRDLTPNAKEYKNLFTSADGLTFTSRVHTAWLFKSGNDWKLSPCLHARIDKKNGNSTCPAAGAFLPQCSDYSLENKHTALTSELGKLISNGKYEGVAVVAENAIAHQHQGKCLFYQKVFSFFKCSGTATKTAAEPGKKSVNGTLVLTASMNSSKHMDWVFHTPSASEAISTDRLAESKNASDIEAIGAYKAYMDSEPDSNEPKAEKQKKQSWNFRLKQLATNEINAIPIFYVTSDGTADISKMCGMGLTQLFHIKPKDNRKTQISPNSDTHHSPVLDLAESIFGIKKESDSARGVAGRVRFKPVIANEPKVNYGKLASHIVVLESPKEYAPLYGKQPLPKAKPGKLNQTVAAISNQLSDNYKPQRKRYPARPFVAPIGAANDKDPKSKVTIHPLPAGTRFETEVVFHNLNAIELGGLLWALQFGGFEGDYRHVLGLAKPYGFGQVSLSIDWSKSEVSSIGDRGIAKKADAAETIGIHSVDAFEKCIVDWVYGVKESNGLESAPEIDTLLQTSDYQIGEKIHNKFRPDIFSYMRIEGVSGNEFAKAKGKRDESPNVLPSYINLSNVAHGV